MLENISTGGIITISLIALAINLWILYEIIRSAVRSALRREGEKQTQFMQQQTRLLAEMLKNSGVPEGRIIDILDFNKPYFLKPSFTDKEIEERKIAENLK